MRPIPTWWNQPSFQEFHTLYSSRGKDALFFLGSGISIQAGLPNWRELLEKMLSESGSQLEPPLALKEFNQLYEQLTNKLPGQEFVSLNQLNDLFDLSKDLYPEIAKYVKQRISLTDKGLWRQTLDRIFLDPYPIDRDSPIHNAIVAAKWFGIVTTNYDTLIEDAYERRFGKPLYVASPNRNEQGLDRRRQERFLFKIHGDIRDPESVIVLTAEDYEGIYGKPGRQGSFEQTSTTKNLTGVLRQAEVILFAGYSHDDKSMRTFYSQAMEHTREGNAFALVPLEGSISQIAEQISRYSNELRIKFIGYSPRRNHAELLEFFKYLDNASEYEAEYTSRIYAKKPTVIMLYCGGTIASSKDEDESAADSGPLRVKKIPSRFHRDLTDFSKRLLNWYQETYNLGSSVELDVEWEVLPAEFQVFSENASPELWNEILKKVKAVMFKYFRAPKIIGDEKFLKPKDDPQLSDGYKRLHQLYDQENREGKEIFGDDFELDPSQFISEFQNRYILGILLLSGTDTMGYLVSALSFGLQHMPCSTIVTGSNQPPDQSIPARLQDLNKSDASKNILTAFYFLQCFGHTLTDSFLCFGDTIHHGVNVRKIASELGPISSSLATDVEPFVFRNLHIRGQYMFRLIDGVFCNNYYPSWIPYSKLVGAHGKELDLRHIRRDPLHRGKDNKRPARSHFCDSSAICHVVASPNLPRIAVREMCSAQHGTPLKVAIIEGYASGTYPSLQGNNFEQLLYDLYINAIPIYLISQYGISEQQQDYEVGPIRGFNIPVKRMSGLTIETALPILSLVINSISENEWGAFPPASLDHSQAESAGELLRRRRNLIETKLHTFYTERPNILTYEIVPQKITKIGKTDDINAAQMNAIVSDAKREGLIRDRGKVSLKSLNAFETKILRLKEKYILLYKRDFSLLASEITRRDESKGAGPDGFAALSDLGFEYGLSLVQAVTNSFEGSDVNSIGHPELGAEPLGTEYGYSNIFSRALPIQKHLFKKAEEIVQTVTSLLRITAVADVREYQVSFPQPIELIPGAEAPRKRFSFTIRSKRSEALVGVDEKYTAVSFSNDDANFFEKLSRGYDPERGSLEHHHREIEKAYQQVLTAKWKHITTSLDWLLIGVFKGVTCGIAEFLRFDEVAIDAAMNKARGNQSVFRKAAHCFVLAGDSRYFEMKLSYCESNNPLGTLETEDRNFCP